MLTRPQDHSVMMLPERTGLIAEAAGDLARIGAMLRRQAKLIAFCILVALAVVVTHLMTAVPKYTATTTILIDSRKSGLASQGADGTLMFETGAIDSQVQILLSEKVAYAVVDRLKLHQNREFMLGEGSLFGTLFAKAVANLNPSRWFSDTPDVDLGEMIDVAARNPLYPDQPLRQYAVDLLEKNLVASRIGRTYVLNVSFTSANPDLAAQIANEFANQYLTDQLESRFDATRRASVWLEDRLEELRKRSSDSASAVQQFKAANNLIAASGRFINEQQLSELNTQIGLARSETARMKARYERLQEIVQDKEPIASVNESLGSPIINELRSRYLRTSKTESEITTKLGPSHIQAVNLRNEMREYERLIIEELGRLAESYRSEYQIALEREKSTEAALKAAMGTNVADSALMVKLAELEREAQTHQNLYQTYLGRFQDAMQQQSFPVTEARVITPAVRPNQKSSPKPLLMIPAALLFGGIVGTGLGLWRELGDRAFRSSEQIREMLGLDLLGTLPQLPRRWRTAPEVRSSNQNGFATNDQNLRYTLDSPLSPFSEALRSVKVAADLSLDRRSPIVIGVISLFPGEGKTTVAKNLATLIATQGTRTLLVDGDLRNPELTRKLTPQAAGGLLDCLVGKARPKDVIVTEDKSGLDFLPGATHRRIAHTSELIGGAAMSHFLDQVGPDYDYVIIDLPPIGVLVDARAASPLVDRFVYVVEWGKTPMIPASTTLAKENKIAEKCLGVILNKVVMKKLKNYDSYSSYMYLRKDSHKYYET